VVLFTPHRESIMALKPDDLCYLSAADLAARLRARKLSPVEVIDALAERIMRLNPKLNAYVTLDLANARKDAEMKHKMRREHPDGDLGLLHGVPVAIKDDLEVKGLRFTCGSRLREKEIGKSDDLTVARLRKAGAIILGKTNEPEFGHKGTTDNKLFGTTPTPWNLERTEGGSSGGSAAAVAAGLAYLALGTDIGGSVRIPASCCGIVGLKPSFGRVPRVPADNAFVTQWYIGPLARTVADTALALRVLAGPDDRLKLIDGHLRQSLTPDAEVDVEVLDVTDAEARALLLAIDPLAQLAGYDAATLAALRETAERDSQAVRTLWAAVEDAAATRRTLSAAGSKRAPETVPEQFQVLVTCADEQEQVALLRRFKKEGLTCKALIS
jgi:Asp-tRNA(Asn)/Glu-tRNA(Gln) amidotransferase A subunit family amidase